MASDQDSWNQSFYSPADASRTGDDEAVERYAPPGDRIDCKVDGDRLTLAIRPAASAASFGFGWIVIIWLAVMTMATLLSPVEVAEPFEIEVGIGGCIALVVGWAGGLWLAGYWIAARLAWTLVSVEPHWLVLRFELLGFSRQKEYRLTCYSKAKLVAACGLNEEIVDCVTIAADASPYPRFGVFLSPEEKAWIVARVNHHLGAGECPESIVGDYREPPPFELSTKGEVRFFED